MKANEVIKTLNADIKTAAQDFKDVDTAAATAAQQLGASAAKADLDAKTLEIKTAKYTEVEGLMLKDTEAQTRRVGPVGGAGTGAKGPEKVRRSRGVLQEGA
jgi:hypothetical protein